VTEQYDLIIIGAGSGRLSATALAAQLGARIALVEENRIGGDCTWSGCVPSKTLLKVAKVTHEMRTAERNDATTPARMRATYGGVDAPQKGLGGPCAMYAEDPRPYQGDNEERGDKNGQGRGDRTRPPGHQVADEGGRRQPRRHRSSPRDRTRPTSFQRHSPPT
jgi:hypothetical protein